MVGRLASRQGIPASVRWYGGGAAVLLTAFLVLWAVEGSKFLSFTVIGVIRGMVYGIIALGINLIYKGSRTLNFSQPFMGLFAAFIAWYFVGSAAIAGTVGTQIGGIDNAWWGIRWLRYPTLVFLFDLGSRPRFILAALFALLLAIRISHRIEHDLMRRLENAPRLVTLVATIAVSQGLLGTVLILFNRTEEQSFRQKVLPAVLPRDLSFNVGQLPVTSADIQILIVVPLVVVAAALFFRYTKFGTAIRAAAENREAAQLLGISARRVSSFTWMAAGALAALGALLIVPSQGSLDPGSIGIGVLIRALAASLLGGLTSLPGALMGGLAVGVTEFGVRYYTNTIGIPEVAFFAMVFAVLVVRAIIGRRSHDVEDVALVPSLRDLPRRLRRHPVSRRVRATAIAIGIMLASAVSLATGPFTNGVLIDVLIFAIVGVSLTVLIGYAGQLSLGHWALVGVGAFASGNLYDFGPIPFAVMVPIVVAIGMVVALILGFAGVWIRGPYLAVVTLAFAVACSSFIFSWDKVARGSSGITVTAPDWGWFNLGSLTNRPLYFFALACFLACVWVAWNFKQSRSGRAFFTLRENEKAAETFGVQLTRHRLLAFTISGGMASLAGVILGMRLGIVASNSFDPLQSMLVVAMVIIGGLGSLVGSVLGAFLLFGAPPLLQSALGDHPVVPFIVTFASGLALILVITRARGGLAGLLFLPRDPVVEGMVYEAEQIESRLPERPAGGDGAARGDRTVPRERVTVADE